MHTHTHTCTHSHTHKRIHTHIHTHTHTYYADPISHPCTHVVRLESREWHAPPDSSRTICMYKGVTHTDVYVCVFVYVSVCVFVCVWGWWCNLNLEIIFPGSRTRDFTVVCRYNYRYAVSAFIRSDERTHGVAVVTPTNHREIPGSSPGKYNLQLRLHQNLDLVDRRLRVS